mmetsp:Transcript_34543/g.84632  ORF Transcript_34543/g.84632 Transcript_34543/m.84632 type:complete len:227 (+) Transcript_34543:433-1113(+)
MHATTYSTSAKPFDTPCPVYGSIRRAASPSSSTRGETRVSWHVLAKRLCMRYTLARCIRPRAITAASSGGGTKCATAAICARNSRPSSSTAQSKPLPPVATPPRAAATAACAAGQQQYSKRTWLSDSDTYIPGQSLFTDHTISLPTTARALCSVTSTTHHCRLVTPSKRTPRLPSLILLLLPSSKSATSARTALDAPSHASRYATSKVRPSAACTRTCLPHRSART